MAMVEMDDDFTMTGVSDEFAAKIMARNAAVGTSFVDMFDEADSPQVRDALSRSASGGAMETIIGLRILAVGSGPNDFPRTVTYNWTVLGRGDGGGFVGAASQEGVGADASSSEAEELKDFFNKDPIALHWLSGTGKVLWANDRELEVLGYSREEYIGMDIMNFCPDSRDEVLEIFHQLGSGNTIRDVPIRFRTKAGKIQDLLIDSNVNYKSDGTFNHTRCFIRDDTGRIVRESRAEAAATASKKLAEGKERFSSLLLHAVRTPLHAISMCLSETNSGISPIIANQVRALTGLLASVSKAMKFDDGYFMKPVTTSFKLASLLSEYRRIQGVSHKVAVEKIGFDRSLVVVADSKMIKTVLDELVAHADQRSPAGATVSLSVELMEKGGGETGRGKFEFRVIDCGEKLDEARVEKVFHNYWLGDANVLDGRVEGVDDPMVSDELCHNGETPGLRLNVAFNFVQCLGSTLRVFSDISRTTFSFKLDLEMGSCESQDTAREAGDAPRWESVLSFLPQERPSMSTPVEGKQGIGLYDSGGRHVLIVEDNTICQKMCKRIVANLGHTVDTADNGAIAVDKVSAREVNIFDLVLMDLRMPVMDGITAARKIHEIFPELPIVALSAEESESTQEEALEVMVAFMSKPTDAAGIQKVIQEHARSPLGQRNLVGRANARKPLPSLKHRNN